MIWDPSQILPKRGNVYDKIYLESSTVAIHMEFIKAMAIPVCPFTYRLPTDATIMANLQQSN